MSYPINKKEVYSARYPKGTIVELTEPIDDKYSPKPVGSRFKVDYVDDAYNYKVTGCHQHQAVLLSL